MKYFNLSPRGTNYFSTTRRGKTFKSKKSNFPRSYTQRLAYSVRTLLRGEHCSFRNENHCLCFHTVIKVKCQKQMPTRLRVEERGVIFAPQKWGILWL